MSQTSKVALITGISGQDGSYLAELLLSKGYVVHGIVRRNSTLWNYTRIEHLTSDSTYAERLFLHYGDMADSLSLHSILSEVWPDEIYNLAAQSHVQVSFETPHFTAEVSGVSVLNLLETVRSLKLPARIYQACTSEMYSGDPAFSPQNENTPFWPKSPYGAAKLYGYHIARIYRESYGMFVVNGILFNHESERRGGSFVTRKISLGMRDIVSGKTEHLYLGNLSAKRDWGYAPEYMEAAWRMMQLDTPDDFVIATGETHTVEEFAREACRVAGVNYDEVIRVDKRYFRPNEVDHLCGDASKAKKVLGWEPKVGFLELVEKMVTHDLEDI